MIKYFCALCVFAVLLISCNKREKETLVTQYVDPFIGTAEHGHVFPGATVPFGGIQLSPDNPRSSWDWCSGYHYSDSIISSFSHTHLSGTGIGDLQDIRFLPTLTRPQEEIPARYIQANYAKFSHENEKAEPGYYRVELDNGIITELSATTRCGIHYYQYPANAVNGLVIDLTTARNWDRTMESCIKKVNNRTLSGYRKSRGWANDQRVYFVIEFSQDVEVFAGREKFSPLSNGQQIKADSCYAWVDFGNKTNKILAKVSLSSANIDGAEANMQKELPHWSFDKVKRDARQAWKRELSKTKAESDNEEDLKVFYTALYHAYLAPYTFSDVLGNFKGPDREIHSVGSQNVQYTVFSFWDTFRAAHPLFTLTQRKRINDMIHSMLKHYDAYGLLPVWELVGNETNCMIGIHSIPVIVEAYLKGIGDFDAEKAYEAMKKSVMAERAGLKELREYGYIPYNKEPESVSKTLEYAYDDWCVAQMAKALNKESDYLYFLKQSQNYKHLFDAKTGFMRGKSSDGKWKLPFSPIHSEHRVDEYTEGNAWQYSWFVPHDVEGLIALHGGKENFTLKLDSLFNISSEMEGNDVSPDISGMIGQYAQGNEPSHHVVYLYNYVGQPHKTQFYIDKIRKELYTTGPDGLCGNEDCGQMSAWYVFSAMGFYPVNPVEMKYQLGTPLFKKLTLKVGREKRFVIKANKENDQYIYIQKVLLNGKELNRTYITHDEIMQGGELEFVLTDKH
ncbi:MAG: GH92 family glycosyl hydrolase [Oscillibacter sp.]|nr:GH92 family glycosyl hydrolase [Oscillibacter sp.]